MCVFGAGQVAPSTASPPTGTWYSAPASVFQSRPRRVGAKGGGCAGDWVPPGQREQLRLKAPGSVMHPRGVSLGGSFPDCRRERTEPEHASHQLRYCVGSPGSFLAGPGIGTLEPLASTASSPHIQRGQTLPRDQGYPGSSRVWSPPPESRVPGHQTEKGRRWSPPVPTCGMASTLTTNVPRHGLYFMKKKKYSGRTGLRTSCELKPALLPDVSFPVYSHPPHPSLSRLLGSYVSTYFKYIGEPSTSLVFPWPWPSASNVHIAV